MSNRGGYMRRFLCVFLAFIAFMYLSCGQEEAWFSFSSHEGGFFIEAPGVMDEHIATMETMIGPIQFTTYVLEREKVLYMVGYSDWPDTLVEKNPDGLLDFAIEGAVTSIKGKMLRNAPIVLGSHNGRELIVDMVSMNQEHTIRIYLVENRMYQLSVLIPKRDEFKAQRTRFLNSFRLLGGEAG